MALKRVTLTELREAKSRQLTQILADGYVPTRIELEDAVLDLITQRRLRTTRRQQTHRPRASPPTSAGPTSASSSKPTASEWHDDPIAQQDDADRQAILEAHGERVLRVTWAQTIANPHRRSRESERQARPVESSDADAPRRPTWQIRRPHRRRRCSSSASPASRASSKASRRTSPRRGSPATPSPCRRSRPSSNFPGGELAPAVDRVRAPGRPHRRRQGSASPTPATQAQREPARRSCSRRRSRSSRRTARRR